jgi:hypothetical protein
MTTTQSLHRDPASAPRRACRGTVTGVPRLADTVSANNTVKPRCCRAVGKIL